MNKTKIASIVAGTSFLATAIAPSILLAAPVSDQVLTDPITVYKDKKDLYTDGYEVELEVIAGEYKKVTIGEADTAKDYELVDKKATIKLPVLNADSEFLSGEQEVTIVYTKEDDSTDNGVIKYTVKVEDKAPVTVNFNVNCGEMNIKKSAIPKVKEEGLGISIDLSEIINAGVSIVKVVTEDNTEYVPNAENKVIIPVDVLDDDDKVIEGSKSLNLKFYKTADEFEVGTATYTVTYTDDSEDTPPEKPDIKLYLDVVIEKVAEIKKSQLDSVKDGLDAEVDISNIVKVGDDFASLDVENVGNGIAFDATTHKATFKVPVVDKNGEVLDGTNKLTLTYNRADGTKETGSFTYTIKYTDDTVVEPKESVVTLSSNVTATVNGVALTSGKTVAAGDVIKVTAVSSRGKKATAITVNGNKVDFTKQNVLEYTVKEDDEALSFDAVLEDLTSYSVTIPENVTANAITETDNIALKSGDKVYDGEKVKITASVPEGKTLKSLKVNGSSIENGQSITVNGTDINITVEYETKATVSITIPEGVTVTKGTEVVKNGASLAKGDVIKVSASKTGYSVKSLTVNGESFVNGSTYTVGDKNVVIAVEFTTSTITGVYPVTLKFADENEDSLKGVEITIKDSNKEKVATAETDKKGKVELELAPGRYTISVTSVPDGYLEPSDSFTFTISDAGKVRGTTSVTIAQSEVTLKKVDAVTNKGIPGVSLVVKNEDKETVASGVTDSNGELKVKGLPAGKYTYSEKYAASGYASDEGVYKFTINDDGKVTGTTSTSSNPIAITFTVKDYASGKGISGAKLVIKNQLGRTVATITTNANGEASVPGLTPGRYILTQSEAPSNYSRDTNEYTFDVLASGMTSGVTSITNKAKADSSSNSNTNTSTNNGGNSQSSTAPSADDNSSNSSNNNTTSNNSTTNTNTSTSTNTTTTTTTTTGGKNNYSTIKTGIETTAPKSKAPIIAGVVGIAGVVAGAASFIIGKKNKNK